MRTSGRPSASTVASDMALGSLGSAFTASANQSPNSANGSSASVKSPDVNGVGCLMEVVSAISGVPELHPPAVQSALQCPYRLALYRTWGRVGLSVIAPAGAVMTLILIGVGAGGCSLSRTDGAFAKMDDKEVTGALSALSSTAAPTEADLALARNAASDVLTKGDKDSSQPWENPETGARGSVTPLAEAYSSEGRTCRDFLASYVNGQSENWLQGAACQSSQGRWEIHSLKPWRRG